MGDKQCKTTGTSRSNVIVGIAGNCITGTERQTVLQDCNALNAGL